MRRRGRVIFSATSGSVPPEQTHRARPMPTTVHFSTQAAYLQAAEGQALIPCPRYLTPLDRHQPVLQRPEQMLGVCSGCGCWHLILTRGPDMVLVQLPTPEHRWAAATSGGR